MTTKTLIEKLDAVGRYVRPAGCELTEHQNGWNACFDEFIQIIESYQTEAESVPPACAPSGAVQIDRHPV